MSKVFIGTSGYYQQDFYPREIKGSQKLEYYSRVFNSVEINSSFYHTPRPLSMSNWVNQVEENFQFSFKIFQGFTRFKEEINKEKLFKWLNLFESFKQRREKTVMLFQFPASFAFTYQRLISLTCDLPEGFLYAFEFRHLSWFREDVYQRLKARGHSLVLSDSPIKKDGSRVWPLYDLDCDFAFIRFHGSKQLYVSSYSDEELKEYAQIVKKKISQGKNVYCYFNNDARGFATKNAFKLKDMLGI